MLVSPTERGLLATLGKPSWLPEDRGVDVMWHAQGHWWGVQRKELKDFVASMMDGRLSREVAQMQGGGGECGVRLPVIVIEGQVKFTGDGDLMLPHGPRVTRNQLYGRMWSLALDGVHVWGTLDERETVEWVKRYEAWTRKGKHHSGRLRPGPVVPWGAAANRDWAVHALQGFPGVGVDRAEAILGHFGRVPMRWDVDEAEMMKVKGLGKKTVRGMYAAFEEME